MEEEKEPLILTPPAARRLKLLFGHGAVELPAKLQHALPQGKAGDLPEHANGRDVRQPLWADVMPYPVECSAAGVETVPRSTLGRRQRDVLGEAVLNPQTMQEFQLDAGSLLELTNPDRPEVPPHLARAWPSPEVAPNTAALAPSLAYNLGLALHLHPLLQDAKPPNDHAPAPFRRVCIFRSGASLDTEGEASPFGAQSLVPVAAEIHLSVVREPMREVLEGSRDGAGAELATPLGGDGYSGNKRDKSDEAVDAIQRHFLQATRIVSQGDVLATTLSGDPSTAQLMTNLSIPVRVDGVGDQPDDALQAQAPRMLYFKVTKMLPVGPPAQAVHVGSTVVKLVGACHSGIPVGLRGYLAKDGPPQPSVLGWHPNAAAAPDHWQLEYLGALMPAWREVARALAPLLHPAAATLPLRTAMLLHGPAGSGKRTAVAAAAAALGCHSVFLSCHDIHADGAAQGKVADGVRAAFEVAAQYQPAILVLEQIDSLTGGEAGGGQGDAAAARLGSVLAECITAGLRHRQAGSNHEHRLYPEPVMLVACAASADDVPAPLRRCFTHELLMDPPDRDQREELLRSFFGAAGRCLGKEEWEDLARHTAGLLPRDLRSLAAGACASASLSVVTPADVLAEVECANGTACQALAAVQAPFVGEKDILTALTSTRDRTATDIGAPKIPNVLWDDVGGLEDVKAAILDTVELPLKHPELFSGGLRRRSGVLLYGPPGTGKTLLAKAVATECAVNFLSVKGPELINMYVGESERLVRDVFARARRARPCVVFFDELDSLAPARGRGSDSGGVMDRVVSQLLAEIDSAQGGSGTDDVFIVGATNRPDLLDPALLRPGRLDKLLYVGVAGDAAAQLKVIKALCRKFALEGDVDLAALAEGCPPRLTGADLYALCSDAWMTALKRRVKEQRGKEDEGSEAQVVVRQDDFEQALKHLRPSLRAEDIAHYESIRDQYQGGKPPVG